MIENENKELNEIEVNDAEIVTPDSDEVKELREKYDAILEKAKSSGMKNVPYRKIINEKGELANPIKGGYFNPFPSRRQRRALIRGLYTKTSNKSKS